MTIPKGTSNQMPVSPVTILNPFSFIIYYFSISIGFPQIDEKYIVKICFQFAILLIF